MFYHRVLLIAVATIALGNSAVQSKANTIFTVDIHGTDFLGTTITGTIEMGDGGGVVAWTLNGPHAFL